MITPPVGSVVPLAFWSRLVALFGLGSVISGTLIALLLYDAGGLARGDANVPQVLALASFAALTLQIARPHSIPTLFHRQTARNWRYRFGWTLAALCWGLDIGAVLSTRVNYATTYLVLLAVVLAPSTSIAILLLLAYTMGRVVMITLGLPIARALPGDAVLVSELTRGQKSWQLVHVMLILTTGAGLMLGLWSG